MTTRLTEDKIAGILAKHRAWLDGDESGVRADLRYADLRSADLRSADLSGADLSGADLSGADLRSADLSGADLRSAYLSGADLSGAYLSGADLRSAYLSGAYLSGADLSGADLSGADLSGADLSGAYLRSAKNADIALAITSICPEGSIIGWKKCLTRGGDLRIVKLRIPEDAKRGNATGRKCRASKAEVLEVQTMEGDPVDETVYSRYDPMFAYAAGSSVEPIAPFDVDRFNECASGIHFFITREEAVDF